MKWTKEQSEKNKNNLLDELKCEPFNVDKEGIKLFESQLTQLIAEEEERQTNNIPKSIINFIDDLIGKKKNNKYEITPLVINPITKKYSHSIIEIDDGIKVIKYTIEITRIKSRNNNS